MKIDVNNKILLKILSGFIAIFLWAAITYTEDPVISQTISGIQVKFEGEKELAENGLVITNSDSLPDISVVIRGTRSNVISSMGSVTAVADVSGISEKGTNTVSLKYNYPSGGITLVKSKTQEVTVETEKLVSRIVPIKVKTINQEKNLTHLIEAVSSREGMEIRGAESEIYKIDYAQAVIDVSEKTENEEKEYTYKFYDDEDDVISGSTVIYRELNTVNVKTTAYKKVNIPVTVVIHEDFNDNYVLKLKSISVQNVDAGVPEGAIVKEAKAVVSELTKTQAEILLTVPDGVYIPEEKRKVKVEYQLEPKILKEVEVEVTADNVPEGKTAEIYSKKIKVSVKGAESEISADKIKATIDMMSTQSNIYHVQFDLPEGLEIVGSYTTEAVLH